MEIHSIYWVSGLALTAVVLIFTLARLVANNKQRQIRKRLGLPMTGRLTENQQAVIMGFENTDMKLKGTFPTMCDTQRQAMARDVLRRKGVIPKTRTVTRAS